MGSRRGRYAALTAAALVGACAVGAPPGFSDGESWTIPLVGPLEDGLLLVPALVNNRGPFVFAIDPDAHLSIIDQEVAQEAGARVGQGPRIMDEAAREQRRFFAEITEWQLGTLTVKQKTAQVAPPHTYDAGGRRIHGVIGRDLIADTLVFMFDRDAGIVTLATQKGFSGWPGATRIEFSRLQSQLVSAEVVAPSRKLVAARIGGGTFAMHVDFGAVPSQLRAQSWPSAKLAESTLALTLVDEVGSPRIVKQQAIAEAVTVGSVTTRDVPFVPYADRRFPEQDIDGALGLSFWKPFAVAAAWDDSAIFVRPRGDRAANVEARIGRWQSRALSGCAHLGCIEIKLIDPLAGKPPEELPAKHPGLVASITRDATALPLELEVLVAVTPADGKPALQWLLVNMPGNTAKTLAHLSADYLGATLTVLDASPFPRSCPAEGGCVDLLAAP